MDPDRNADRGSDAEGEAARDRLRALLTHAAGAAVAAGLMDGLGGDDPGEGVIDDRPSTGSRGVADGIAGRRDQIACSGEWSRQLEDLQLTAGQGPCLDAFAAGAPVLVGRLVAEAARWPGFAAEALAVGVAAVFSLPLQVGAVGLGTLDLYRITPGSLTPAQLDAALLLAGLATETLLEHAADSGRDRVDGVPADPGWLRDVHAEVHQASGMVAVAEHIGVGQALVRIRAHAYASARQIAEVAARIIAHDLVLGDHDPS